MDLSTKQRREVANSLITLIQSMSETDKIADRVFVEALCFVLAVECLQADISLPTAFGWFSDLYLKSAAILGKTQDIAES